MRLSVPAMLLLLTTPALAEQPEPLPTQPAAEAPPRPGRLLLDTAVLGAGLGLAAAGAFNLTQANAAYGDYLALSDDAQAAAFLEADVRPRQIAGIAELGAAAACLGVGIALWSTTDGLSLTAGPGALGVAGRF